MYLPIVALLCFSLITFSAQSIPVENDLKIYVGQSWNEVNFIEHFTVLGPVNRQGKTTLSEPFNPLTYFDVKFRTRLNDLYFFKFSLNELYGFRGLFQLSQSLQENPFDTISNADGLLTTIIFNADAVVGLDIPIRDYFRMSLGIGFFNVMAKRLSVFEQQAITIQVNDNAIAPLAMIDARLQPSRNFELLGEFSVNVSSYHQRVLRCPDTIVILYDYPQMVRSKLAVEARYDFDCGAMLGATCTTTLWMSTKRGCVTIDDSQRNLFADNYVSYFRSQYFTLAFYTGYSF